MIVNKYVIRGLSSNDKELTLPINMGWQMSGLEDSIELYEEDIIKEVIGIGNDYEVTRFSHEPFNDKTLLTYSFNFYKGESISKKNNWSETFLSKFSVAEVFYNRNVFNNSFFKLDFYDTTSDKRQKNYLTTILSPSKGIKTSALLSQTTVNINKPRFELDFVGNTEGFFVYWMKDESIVGVNTFYVSCKFYDARIGAFSRMMTRPQSDFSDPYDFDNTRYFYYKFVLDYTKRTYAFYDVLSGQKVNTLLWYEYVNP